MSIPKIIAFYLPQYHPTPHNDEWWGKGFTEWTNVAKAPKLYPGHYQPKVPADLGFYDLRIPEVREQQAELAREAGIHGFCYYHYWFGDGHEELDLPFKEVIRNKKPDFPFCLCWANESWHAKFWDKDGKGVSKRVLAEQKYLGKEDNEKHFYSLLKAFKDDRYIKIDGKLLFMIYQPLQFQSVESFMKDWNNLAQQNGLDGFHFVGQTISHLDVPQILSKGFNGVDLLRLHEVYSSENSLYYRVKIAITSRILKIPFVYSYKKAFPQFIGNEERQGNIYPTLLPNWDHSPRSGRKAYILDGATPALFKEHCKQVLSLVNEKDDKDKIIFLKSWNEWGEGNYMEPDLKFGKGYINALREAIEELENK